MIFLWHSYCNGIQLLRVKLVVSAPVVLGWHILTVVGSIHISVIIAVVKSQIF